MEEITHLLDNITTIIMNFGVSMSIKRAYITENMRKMTGTTTNLSNNLSKQFNGTCSKILTSINEKDEDDDQF